jgi:hypothetical protein
MSYTKADIPDFLENVGAQITDAEQRIDTDILEPVIFSDSFLRFQLQNKGLLNPQSRITFSLQATGFEAFYPLSTGVKSIVQRATLKIGGKTICEVDDWAHYDFYKSLFMDQQVVKEREQYLSGRAISNSVIYDDNTNTSTFIGMDLGLESVVSATATNTDMKLASFQKNNRKPVFSIKLEDLIPCLRGVQLPLFMLKEEVQIELTLAPTIGKRCCFAQGNASNKDAEFKLDQDEVRLIADYTFLDGEAMNQFAAANSTYEYTFLEPRMTKTTLANSDAWANQIRNVGGAGRRVPKMFVLLTTDTSASTVAGHNQLSLMNDYRSVAPFSGNESVGIYGSLTSNIKKNDAFIFPIDRSNSALHYHGVQQTEGAVPHITRAMYSRQGNSMAISKFEGYTLNTEDQLSGQFCVQAYRFPDGQRVDSRGLELHYKYSNLAVDEAPFTQRVYIEIEKRVSIINGVVDSSYE